MSEWTKCTLGELARFQRGMTWSKAQETSDPVPGSIAVLRIPNIQERLDTSDIVWITSIGKDAINQYAAAKDWILMVGSNGNPARVGNCVLIKEQSEYLFASFLVGVEPIRRDKISPDYLFRVLRSPDVQRYISDDVQGSTGLSNINLSRLKAKIVELPAPPQQRRIAEILGTVDEAIEQTEALLAKQHQVKAGLMHDLLTRGVTADCRLRPTRDQAPNLYKESPLGWIPKEWEISKVGDVITQIEQGWSPDCDSEPARNDEWGVLKTSAVVWTGFDRTENKKLFPHLNPIPNLKIREGDVLMTRAGPNSRVGVVALVIGECGNLMLSDKLYRLVPKSEIASAYLTLALSADFTQHELNSFKTGLAESQTNISQAIVRKLTVPLASKYERGKICELVNASADNLRKTQDNLTKLRQLKQGLVQDLLTGRVPVKVSAGPTSKPA